MVEWLQANTWIAVWVLVIVVAVPAALKLFVAGMSLVFPGLRDP